MIAPWKSLQMMLKCKNLPDMPSPSLDRELKNLLYFLPKYDTNFKTLSFVILMFLLVLPFRMHNNLAY